MGGAMARALARDRVRLILYNRSTARARELANELGAQVATTPAEVAGSVDVCISMLADEAAVTAVYLGPDGIIRGVRGGTVLAEMSTVSPRVVRSLEARIRATGAGILDAPVSGSVATATAGQLILMVGGESIDLERARPALDALAGRIFHIGPLGAGASMKLAVNTVIYGLNGALSEALVLAERAGIDPSLAYVVLSESAVGAPFVRYKRSAFLDPDDTPPAFTIGLAEKDLRLIRDLAAALGVSMPQARTNLATLRRAETSQGRARDFSAVASYLRTAAPDIRRTRRPRQID
jgi:3-hydroxyisobutyrate dehydrogenase-like beta-hydroxyacid dehydrogenase